MKLLSFSFNWEQKQKKICQNCNHHHYLCVIRFLLMGKKLIETLFLTSVKSLILAHLSNFYHFIILFVFSIHLAHCKQSNIRRMWNDPEEIFATKVRVWTVSMLFTCFQSIKITKKKLNSATKNFSTFTRYQCKISSFFPVWEWKKLFRLRFILLLVNQKSMLQLKTIKQVVVDVGVYRNFSTHALFSTFIVSHSIE